MSIKLRELIRSIRACKTAAEERAVIARECALIRTAFKEEDNQFRHRNVAKLLFIHMLGYPTHFGQMECLKLIGTGKFAEKRVGYLGLTQLLDENTDVLMLVTHSIKKDLLHSNQFVNGLALCALGNIASTEMCRDLATEVEKLMASSNPYTRKKAAMCAARIVRKVDEIEDKFNGRLAGLLEDRNHGVMISGISLVIQLLELNPDYVDEFRGFVPILNRALKSMLMSGYASAADYEISGITDPFLQVKILRCLRLLGKGSAETSDEMNDILAQVATNTEGTKNAGNAILYECVQTIMAIEAESGLRILGINILGRFLLNRDNNIRYVALATLQKVVQVDIKAVQRHRSTILDCLKDTDISIRKRALDVTYALVNEDNIKNMTKELLNYLIVADVEFKDHLVSRICYCVEKYSPSKRWQIDTLIRVMCLAGNYVREETRASFCHAVAGSPDLHAYAVHKLYFSMKESLTQESLVHVGVWCIGEFGDLLVSGSAVGPDQQPIHVSQLEVIDLLLEIAKKPVGEDRRASNRCNELLCSCLAKLMSRFPGEVDRIKKVLRRFENSISTELQQRSCEYQALMQPVWDRNRNGVLDRMPVLERALKPRPSGDSTMDEQPNAGSRQSGGAVQQKSSGPADLLDLDDLLTSDAPAANAGGGYPAQAAPAGGAGGDLLDIFGGGPVDPAPTAAPVQTQNANAGLDMMDIFGGTTPAADPQPQVTAYDKNGIRAVFALKKNLDGAVELNATYSSALDQPLSNFVFEAAVPTYLKLSLQPASGSVLEPRGTLTQHFTVVNTTNGERPMLMKIRIGYMQNGVQAQDMGQVAFPAGY